MPETIVVVDDEQQAADLVGSFLKAKGFNVFTAYSAVGGLVHVKQCKPELVLMDVRMPGMDGITALRQIKANFTTIEVVMVTAVNDTTTAIECLKAGAFGYLIKPIDLQALYNEAMRAIEHRSLVLQLEDYKKGLEDKIEVRTAEIQGLNRRIRENFLSAVRLLVNMLEAYDPFIGGHMRRVAQVSGEIARVMKLPPKEIMPVELAAILHDVGTVTLPAKIRNSGINMLSADELALLRQHPVFAQNIMANIEELETPALYVRSHLERLDGTGFPDGLKDNQIPMGARILAVANAYDELVHRRRFTQEPLQTDEEKNSFALADVSKMAGTHFDSKVVMALGEAVEIIRLKTLNLVKVPLGSLKGGMTLAEDIRTKDGVLLLSSGYSLKSSHIAQIERMLANGMLQGSALIQKPKANDKT